jgi:hypothetical protein
MTDELRYGPQPTPPPHLLNAEARQLDAETAIHRARVTQRDYARDVQALRQQIESDAIERSRRREAELELATYIDDVAGARPAANELYQLDELAESMRQCRQSGAVGIGAHGHVIAWDHKCDQVRLCPHEAVAESSRVAERYVPAMMEWQRARGPGRRRIFYCVLTDHNYRPGQLHAGKRHLFERFKADHGDTIIGRVDACPVTFERIPPHERDHNGPRHRVRKSRARKMQPFPQVAGALVTQEDPLSANGDWNVHLNVVLLVEGPLSYKELRDQWGRNLEVREIRDADENALRDTVAELVKYSARAVPAKSQDKREAGEGAPAMTEWPYDRFVEWYAAQRGFRRTRTYGVLHGIPAPPTESLDDIEWLGTITYESGCYRARIGVPERHALPTGGAVGVDSIPGNNFQTGAAQAGPPERGPPRAQRSWGH